VREITAPSKTHEMDWSEEEEVREEHSNSEKISIQMSVDDNIELMVDDKMVEFVNRVDNEPTLEISNYVQNMSISNNESGRKELTREEKRLRNKCFRDSMEAKIRREKEEYKKLGKVFDKRRICRGKKWKERRVQRQMKGLPVGTLKRPLSDA
jgi:hypothetical protein